jgi:sigma-E factor negative regulatory protein RseB
MLAGRFLLPVLLLWSQSMLADQQSMDLLKRMSQAATSLNYDGVFIHVDKQRIDTLRVIHKIDNGSVHERLYALNGNPREVIRDAERVWCFMPESKRGHMGLRSDRQTGFPGFMVSNLEALSAYYRFSLGEIDRVADRAARQLKILPGDAYRYGYELWADQETGLLLKSVLIDEHSNPVEQYMFASINIDIDIPAADLLPMTSKDELQWIDDKEPKMVTVNDSIWTFSTLPAGYKLIKVMQRSMPMDRMEVQHMVLSDGLAGVSVFIEKTKQPGVQSHHEQMGAVNAYARAIDDWLVTVIGEVPAETVKFIAENLQQKH